MKLSEFSKSSGIMHEEKHSTKDVSQKKKTISETYDELKDCSSNELMQRLAKEIQMQKSSGTFDYDAIINSIEKMKPYLPAQTYENMIRIIDGLK